MTSPRIPKFNEEFDPKLFRFIFFKRLPIIVLIFVAFLIGAYLLLRYTQPVYEAKTIIQIDTESKAEKVLDMGRFSNEQFSQKLELLRSRVFIERVLSRLPLDVRYYNEGKFLNHELYKSSPFSVNYVVINPIVYSIPFKLTYVNDSLFKLTYSLYNGEEEITRETDMSPGKWIEMPEVHLVLHLTSNIADYDILNRQRYFMFEILQTDALYERFVSNINLTVLNEVAKTIQISVRDKNPARASDIANEMASEFQLFDIERKSMSANNILDFIDSQLETVLNDLTEFEDSITSYKKRNNVDTVLEIRRQNSLTQLNAIESELINVQMESNILKNIIDELSRRDTPDALFLMTLLSGSQYQQQLQSDITKLGDLVHKKEQMLIQSPENSSFVASINQQIETQKNLIIKTIGNIKKNTDIRLQDLTKRYNNQYSQAFADGRKPHFELKRLERLYIITEQFYNQLIEKKTEFSILKAGYVPENIILEKALQYGDKVFPSKKKILLIAFLLALFISFVIVALRYLSFNEIVSASEISKYTSVPVLGVLPKYASNIPIQKFIVEKYPKSILAESLRAVRSNLQFITNGKGPKVVAITSTISGEGKTFLAINLAGALAITGKKVIIIDVDMRRPTVHKYFDLSNTIGMSTVLSGQTTAEECIQDIGKYDIKFITAGPIPPNPAELLNDDNFEQLILKLKKEFDYVIIDNPPIGLVSDALKSLQLADYPIYLLRANYSKRNFLSLPEKILQVYNIKNISIVLNGYDNTISNVGMEKDLVYAYGYVKGYKKGLKNSYYEQDVKPNYTILQRLKRLFKRDED
jgi:tyrosine-protein kinase Etk/Wzc